MASGSESLWLGEGRIKVGVDKTNFVRDLVPLPFTLLNRRV
jgi:hypothetical protein